MELGERMIKALKGQGWIATAQVADLLNIVASTATDHLKALCAEGFCEKSSGRLLGLNTRLIYWKIREDGQYKPADVFDYFLIRPTSYTTTSETL